MSKIIDITDKLSDEKPLIKIGEKTYEVDDSVEIMMKLASVGNASPDAVFNILTLAVGEQAAEEIGIRKMSMRNLKVFMTAVASAIKGEDYSEENEEVGP